MKSLSMCQFHEVAFDVPVKKSSWIALRVLPSSHTNPVFVVVGDKPIRASRKSAEWSQKSVDQCWSQKERAVRPSEKEEAGKGLRPGAVGVSEDSRGIGRRLTRRIGYN